MNSQDHDLNYMIFGDSARNSKNILACIFILCSCGHKSSILNHSHDQVCIKFPVLSHKVLLSMLCITTACHVKFKVLRSKYSYNYKSFVIVSNLIYLVVMNYQTF